jgi:ABC-type amino acid transport substrate-binding protein
MWHPGKTALLSLTLCILWTPLFSYAEEPPEKLKVVFRRGSSVFVSGDGDAATGFDVDLMERFIAWNKTSRGQVVSYMRGFVGDMDSLLRVAATGNCDLAIGSVTATAERDEKVDFSDPYLPVRLVLIAPPGRISQGDYTDILVGKRVGAITGSTSANRVKGLAAEVPNLVAKIEYSSNDELFQGLFREPPDVDAAVTDITHYWDLKRKKDIVLAASLSEPQGLAIVLPEGSPLTRRVNDFLESFLHSPSYFTLVRQYFGEEAAEMIRTARNTAR